MVPGENMLTEWTPPRSGERAKRMFVETARGQGYMWPPGARLQFGIKEARQNEITLYLGLYVTVTLSAKRVWRCTHHILIQISII